LDLDNNSIKDSFSSLGVFHFVDGVHSFGMDSKGNNEKEGTKTKPFIYFG